MDVGEEVINSTWAGWSDGLGQREHRKGFVGGASRQKKAI